MYRKSKGHRDINATQRAQLAMSLRAQKLPWDEIAARAGYANKGAAHNAVQREIGRCVSNDVEEMRREELQMLDQLHAMIWPFLMDAEAPNDSEEDDEEETSTRRRKKKKEYGINLWAVDRIMTISERRCRLMGLDTPVNKDVAAANMVVVRSVPEGYFGDMIEGPKEA